MKTVKKIAALLLCAALMLTCFAGCHEKNAVVANYKSGDKEYTVPSGVYLAMLINADSEARSTVTTTLSEAGQSTTDIDFSKQTVKDSTGKEHKFYDYVVIRAKELTAEYVLAMQLYDKYGLKMSEENKAALEQYAINQWDGYGASYLYEENGVSYDSYVQYLRVNMFMVSDIFDHLYGEGGEKAPSEETIVNGLKEHFDAANILEIATTNDEGAELSEDELKAIEEKLQAYCDRINGGTATFAEIKAEYEAEEEAKAEAEDEEGESTDTDTESESDTDTETETETEEEDGPADENEVLLGDDETSVAATIFDDVHALEIGKATVLKGSDGYYRLAIRKDITADEYYYDNYRDETVRIMYAEEFDEDFSKQAANLKITFDDYEIGYLKPKKIDYEPYEEWYAGIMQSMTGVTG